MRYIRFLKTPRILTEKGTAKRHVYCLIAVTSDLGDSFLPYDVELSAELISPQQNGHVLVWHTVQWTAGMRTLPITLPLSKAAAALPLCVRVGVEPKAAHDDYHSLSDVDSRGVVSAWSAGFSASAGSHEAVKLVERRFGLSSTCNVSLWEETGESIARHLWDAGITLSCHLTTLLDSHSALSRALLPNGPNSSLHVLELGSGCGVVGLSLARIIPGAQVLLTDLPEAEEIVVRNIVATQLADGASVGFRELDWDAELPAWLPHNFNLVLAADCTYNPDSSPALVNTLSRLADMSRGVVVGIAMKMRHKSEEVFFDLMATAGFKETATLEFPLPGDVELGEEIVYLHVYRHVA